MYMYILQYTTNTISLSDLNGRSRFFPRPFFCQFTYLSIHTALSHNVSYLQIQLANSFLIYIASQASHRWSLHSCNIHGFITGSFLLLCRSNQSNATMSVYCQCLRRCSNASFSANVWVLFSEDYSLFPIVKLMHCLSLNICIECRGSAVLWTFDTNTVLLSMHENGSLAFG